MNGIIDIKINKKNKTIKYEFSLYRNITLIRGDSGTGKTTLYNLIKDYEKEKEKSGVIIRTLCNGIEKVIPLVTLSGPDWQLKLKRINDSVVFIDEGCRFIKSKEFAKRIQKSNNYYVFITRENLEDIPSSINEIYEIQTKKKLHTLKRKYILNKNYLLDNKVENNDFEILLTEDSNSGFQFFQRYCSMNNKSCDTSKGNANIYKKLCKFSSKRIFLFADGAAIAPFIDDIYKFNENHNKVVLCFPESFEYLLLKSNILKNIDKWDDEINKPYNYIDYSKFLTFEQYFHNLIVKVTENNKDKSKYSKKIIPEYYVKTENIKKIVKLIGLI